MSNSTVLVPLDSSHVATLMRVAPGSIAERMVHAKAPILLVREGAAQPSD